MVPVPTPSDIARRRVIFAGLCFASWIGAIALAAATVEPGFWGPLTATILILFAGQLPWGLMGFWNAVIGFAVTRWSADPIALCAPPVARADPDAPISASTAVLMCIRNEDTDSVFTRLAALLGELVSSSVGDRFHLYILSDTSDTRLAQAEETAVARLDATWRGRVGGLTYRRRAVNTGFKAGNIRDFCLAHGANHEFSLVLDADSFMSGGTILRCVRVLQANPTLGILQCLTVGLPSLSPLARLFQFGMRLGMRAYTLGASWWQADCGPYWGHNALIRLAPFTAHCDLPSLPGKPPFGGDILSHDQIEAVLMRRAGFEVRVVPEEGGSYEENPPTLIEFLRRDLRWCLGNLQYFTLLSLPGLKPTSRVQLLLAIWMFLASGLNVGFWLLTLVMALSHPDGDWIVRGPAYGLIALMLALTFAPKIATALVVLLDPGQRAAWGGSARFISSFFIEVVFSLILTPIMQVSETAAIVLLCFGRTIGWHAQTRGEHAVPFGAAVERFWPHTALGLVLAAALAAISPATALWSLPVYGGLIVAIPLAVLTSMPTWGAAMAAAEALAIPEDLNPPPEILALDLPALQRHRLGGDAPPPIPPLDTGAPVAQAVAER